MRVIYNLIIISLICLKACNSEKYEDPIWHINPESKGTEILRALNSGRNRYSFSYKKRIEWQNPPDKAIVNCYLTQPYIENDQLKLLRYTISVDLINNNNAQFNKAFYEYFKNQLTQSFGKPVKEKEQSNKILLNWDLKNNMSLSLDVSKEFNSYFVEYKK